MRETNDVLRSLARYVGKVLGVIDPAYEVRLAYERDLQLVPPFAVVGLAGADDTSPDAVVSQMTQPLFVHVYPPPLAFQEPSQQQALAVKQALWTAFEAGIPPYVDQATALPAPQGLTAALAGASTSASTGVVYYRVSAFDANGFESAPSGALAVLPGGHVVVLTWTPVDGAVSYRVYRQTDPGSPYAKMTSDAATAGYSDDGGGSGTGRHVPVPVVSGRRRVPLYDYEGIDLEHTSFARYPSDYFRIVAHSESLLPDTDDPRQIRVVVDLRAQWRQVGSLPSTAVPARTGTLTINGR